MSAAARRIAVSPYARRLARERGLALEDLTGSGPSGRVVAADVIAFVPRPKAAPQTVATGVQSSAIATTIALGKILGLLSSTSDESSSFTLEDVVLRAVGCALDDVADSTTLSGNPVALEAKLGGKRAQLVFTDIRKSSLGPLHQRRVAAVAAAADQAAEPAALSVRVITAGDIRPVSMPLLPGRAMRLVLVAGPESSEALLTFDSAAVDEDVATEILSRIKGYLEVPIRLLA